MTWLAAVAAVAASLLQVAFLHTAVTAATLETQDITAAFFHVVNVTDMIKLVLLGTVVGGLTIMLVRSGPVPGSAGRPCPLRVSCRWPVWPSCARHPCWVACSLRRWCCCSAGPFSPRCSRCD